MNKQLKAEMLTFFTIVNWLLKITIALQVIVAFIWLLVIIFSVGGQ